MYIKRRVGPSEQVFSTIFDYYSFQENVSGFEIYSKIYLVSNNKQERNQAFFGHRRGKRAEFLA